MGQQKRARAAVEQRLPEEGKLLNQVDPNFFTAKRTAGAHAGNATSLLPAFCVQPLVAKALFIYVNTYNVTDPSVVWSGVAVELGGKAPHTCSAFGSLDVCSLCAYR